ncbi:hypothetical protein V5N11_012487 [Cardamine amara subsp. amara]|uniref:DUF4283 domain-containing protein n=1 Tax=Cardamine amara subsp. amara TaxID=228776 RepID=A0ABD0Z1A7_CARAN
MDDGGSVSGVDGVSVDVVLSSGTGSVAEVSGFAAQVSSGTSVLANGSGSGADAVSVAAGLDAALGSDAVGLKVSASGLDLSSGVVDTGSASEGLISGVPVSKDLIQEGLASGIPAAAGGGAPGVLAKGLPRSADSVSQNNVGLPKKSWISVASKSNLTKFDYEVSTIDGKEVVEVPDEALEGTPLWEDFLIGRFASTAPHIAKIHVIVNKIWTLGDKSIRIDAYRINDTTVKFRIRNVSARLRALRRGMWNICEIPMVVSKWSPIVEEAQPAVKSMPLWVKILNVPHSMFTWKGISFLASPVGTPLRLHPETELVTNFDEAKVFVEVDLTKELPQSYFFNIKGSEVNVTFEYPWLPQRCGTCANWGHGSDGCLANGGKRTQEATSSPSPVSKSSVEASPMSRTVLREVDSDKSQSDKRAPASETLVVVEVNKGLLVMEQEEGEIIENLQKEKNSEMAKEDDGGWETTSSGRTANRKSRDLAYGQVTILSPSRFDVLRDQQGDENTAAETDGLINQNAEVNKAQLSSELDNGGDFKKADVLLVSQNKPGGDGVGVRPSLPRNSKST